MTIIHWPTYEWDTELTWCACDNRTFPSEQAWQDHVVDAVLAERGEKQEMECVDLDYFMRTPKGDLRWGPLTPTETVKPYRAEPVRDASIRCVCGRSFAGTDSAALAAFTEHRRTEHPVVVTPTNVTAEHADRGE